MISADSTAGRLVSATLLLALCAAAGLSLAFLFDDGCQLDGALHFLYAKWAWVHQELFVGVWARPLYTLTYSIPALAGYRAARLFTVLICLIISWQTWRLAEDLTSRESIRLLTDANRPLAIILVWLQPSFFLFSADNMTEPVFALVYVIALRLHHRGRKKAGMLVASLTILARPEGFFLGILWACWILWDVWRDSSVSKSSTRISRSATILLLSCGAFLWWLAALVITGDPLFILHNWPSNWPVTGTIYGAPGMLAYPVRLPEIIGPLLLPPFFAGLYHLIKSRKLATLTSSFLLFFVLHTILRAYGLLGSAGYPRYLISISPAIAIITLVGWTRLAELFRHTSKLLRRGLAVLVIGVSLFLNFTYADGAEWSRDAKAIAAAHARFAGDPRPITRFIFSQPYACILFDRDPWENPVFTNDIRKDLDILRNSPAGTLAVWDDRVGPKWYGLTANDFERAGFVRLDSQEFSLKGYLLDRSWFGFGGPRAQRIHLLYKTTGASTYR